jgi:hypothetical protein
MRLVVEPERERYHPGEVVTGRVVVEEGGGSARWLEVALEFCERTPDHHAVARNIPGEIIDTGPLAAGDAYDFAIALPADALPGVRTDFAALYWRVYASAAQHLSNEVVGFAGDLELYGREAEAERPIGVVQSDAGEGGGPTPA